MSLGHENENFHNDTVVVTLWMFPGLSVRKSAQLPGKCLMQLHVVSDTKVNLGVVKVANQFLQWQGSLY